MAKNKKDKSGDGGKQKNTLMKVLTLFFGFALSYALLRAIIAAAERFGEPLIYYIGTVVYAVAVGVLFAVFYSMNGFTFDNRDREADELPARRKKKKKAEYIKRQPERRARAKKLLYVLLPAVVAMLVSLIELNFFG